MRSLKPEVDEKSEGGIWAGLEVKSGTKGLERVLVMMRGGEWESGGDF